MRKSSAKIPVHEQSLPSLQAGLFVWFFGAVFYLLGFFHRVAPAVITGELMQDFSINAAALGNLSAFYFYSYVAMQIPTGILADRLGPRRLLSLGSLVAALGSVIFGLASHYWVAALGRTLIGGSVAVAFVGLLKIAANWFSPARFAMVSGLALFFGVVGAVSAGTPLRLLVDLLGWRPVMLLSAAAAVATGAGTWFFVRDYPHEKGYRDFIPVAGKSGGSRQSYLRGVLQVFRYKNILPLFFIPGGIVGCVLTFSGLWGVPYLTTMHHITDAQAAILTSALLVAWAIGSPLLGWLSDRLQNRKLIYIIGCGLSLCGFTVIVFCNTLSLVLLVPVLLLTGFASGSMIISFAFAKESVPIQLAGTVSGVVNMGVMMGPMILQPGVGWMLERLWSGEVAGGVPIYSAATYKSGFSLMLGWLLLSFLLLFFTRDTHCRQLEEATTSGRQASGNRSAPSE